MLSKIDFKKFKKLEALGDKRDKQQEQVYQKLLKEKETGNDGDRRQKPKGKFSYGNDFSWWNKYPELMKDAANLLSNWIPGTNIEDTYGIGVTGVVGITIHDMYGADMSATDPINMAARDIYLNMFRKYRGISAYQAADVAAVIIASIEVIKMVAFLERVYGIINRYNKSNWNMPYAELAAMGIPNSAADYIRDHMSDYRYDLNLLINKAQRLCVPNDLSIISDKLSLYSFEYCDYKESERAQIILFSPDYFGRFDETSLSTGSSVHMIRPTAVTSAVVGNGNPINTSGTGIMFPFLEDQISRLVGSDSVQKIFGDFMAWFGEGQLIRLLPLPEDFLVVPVYSESILHKFHNCETGSRYNSSGTNENSWPVSVHNTNLTATDQGVLGTSYWMHQYDNVFYTAVSWVWGTSVSATGAWGTIPNRNDLKAYGNNVPNSHELPFHLLDSIHSEYTDEIVCEASLFKKPIEQFNFTAGSNTYYVYLSLYAGLEVIDTIVAYVRTSNGMVNGINFYTTMEGSQLGRVARLSAVDWAPNYYVAIFGSGATYCTPGIIGGEVDRARVIDNTTLGRILRAAVFSAFKSDLKVIS